MDIKSLRTLFFLDQVQDLDLLLPLIREAMGRPGRSVSVSVTERFWKRSPRARRVLAGLPVPLQRSSHYAVILGLEPELGGADLLITASESSARPHRAAHHLTRRAARAGVHTVTLQHGLENVGLTYTDTEYPIETVRFASDMVLIWGPLESLHIGALPETRAKCIPTGCPKPARAEAAPFKRDAGTRGVIGVFENLHWSRYDRKTSERFIDQLAAAAEAHPSHLFWLKPHHDQRWLARVRDRRLSARANIRLADPADPQWEPYTAASFIEHCDAVITTPSTVALDAAAAGRPVAVFGDAHNPSLYEPLDRLYEQGDWERFIATADRARPRAAAFFRRRTLGYDAACAALDAAERSRVSEVAA